jgi:hypothetical protein
MSSSNADRPHVDVEQIPIRGGGHFFRHPRLDIPQAVRDAILATPKVNTVIGDKRVQESIIRCDNFQFGYHSNFVFELGKNGDPLPPFLAIAAHNLFIITPEFSEIVSTIRYESFVDLNARDQTQQGADGVSYSPYDESGSNGGAGQPGPTGPTGRSLELPPLYILFQAAYLSAQLPVSVEILSVYFHGVRGGRGGAGGRGGNGGNGATGRPSKCKLEVFPFPGWFCKSGPGNGGHGGMAGQGGRGGDGGKGGDGATVIVAAPEQMLVNYGGFFGFDLPPGSGGQPGGPGRCGSYGTHGEAGFRCFACLRGADHGHDGGYPNPIDLGPGDPGSRGADGTVTLFERDNSDLF